MASPAFQLDFRLDIGELSLAVSLELKASTTVLVGPNGSGKTTLLRAIAGAPLPVLGVIAVDGLVYEDSGRGLRLSPEARGVGYVPQGFGLFPHMTAIENAAFGCRDRHHGRELAVPLLEKFGVLPLADRYPRELSGGEQQRVALARALLIKPRCLLLDEPLSALDARTRRTMRSFLVTHLRKVGVPTLVITHDANDVLALDGHVIALEDGEVVQEGAARDLAAAPATPFLSELFVGPS